LAPSANHTWVLDPAHPFQGLSAGSHLTMLRNSDNYDPIEHDGPQWRNLTQAELEENGPFIGDCPADLNADEFIDAADLSVLLANWGPNAHGPADIDDDGDVDSVDLSHLLSAWGPCM
ncbi:MAG: hypothetical protein KDA25_01975, partial [Phycisphaerales bacterium]|nr:hypothetical protein [Phycisphaerales bacterium]